MKPILFIWIPKCGGTTICHTFKLDNQTLPPPRTFDNNSNVTFGHIDINTLLNKEIISKEFYNKSFKFCIVRNPYDRAVSLFHYLNLDKKYSFDDWVNYLYKNKHNIPINCDKNLVKNGDIINQWNLMESWVLHDIDKIYYFEDGFNYIVNDINKNIGNKCNNEINDICILNRSKHKNYKEYYKNEQTKNYIYEIYKNDFIKFKYSKNI